MKLKLFSNNFSNKNSYFIIAKTDMFEKVEGYLAHDKVGALFGKPSFQKDLDDNVEKFKLREGADQTVRNLEKISFCDHFKVIEVALNNNNTSGRSGLDMLFESIGRSIDRSNENNNRRYNNRYNDRWN